MIPHDPRSLAALAHDCVAAVLAWWAAFLVRFNFDIPPFFEARMLETMPWVVAFQAILFLAFGLYRGMWRYASMPDLRRILAAGAVSGLLLPVLVFFLQVPDMPRSVLLFDAALLVLLMGTSRVAYRSWNRKQPPACFHRSRRHRCWCLVAAMQHPSS